MSLSLLLSLGTALADTPTELPDINVQYFRPAIDSSYFMWVNESHPGKDKAFNLRGVLSYTSKPLVYNDGSGNIVPVLSSLTQLDLMGGYTFGKLRLGVDVPVLLQAQGTRS